MEEVNEPRPRIYIADLAAYNSGKLHGMWVDLSVNTTMAEVQKAIQAMLAESPVLPPDIAEEYAIHDHEGFYNYNLGEHESLENVVAMAALIAECGELAADLLNCGYSIAETKNGLDEHYAGVADSLEEWVTGYLEDSGALAEIPERWHAYINFESYASDLELGGDIFTIDTSEGKVHVFWTF